MAMVKEEGGRFEVALESFERGQIQGFAPFLHALSFEVDGLSDHGAAGALSTVRGSLYTPPLSDFRTKLTDGSTKPSMVKSVLNWVESMVGMGLRMG